MVVELSNRDKVGRGFELLAEGLGPFVEYHLKAAAPGGMDWLEWLAKRHKQNPGLRQSKTDPLVLLRAITQEKDVFKGILSRVDLSYAQELWECRNNWAHYSVFNQDDTRRLLDTTERLLRDVGAVGEADAVRRLFREPPSSADWSQNSRPPQPHPAQQASRAPGDAPVAGIKTRDRNSRGANGNFPSRLGILAAFGLFAGSLVALAAVGLAVLPSATFQDKSLIIGASAALSVAGVAAVGAWQNERRFAATVTAGGLALVCLACLSIVTNRAAVRERAHVASSSAPSGGHAKSTPAGPSHSGSPPSAASSQGAASNSGYYLTHLHGSSGDTDTPQFNSWTMEGHTYLNCIGYPGLASEVSVTYQLNGALFKTLLSRPHLGHSVKY